MMALTKTTKKIESLFRYFCDACTNVAFVSEGTEPKKTPSNCEHCKMPIGKVKPQNFLPLESNHPCLDVPRVYYK